MHAGQRAPRRVNSASKCWTWQSPNERRIISCRFKDAGDAADRPTLMGGHSNLQRRSFAKADQIDRGLTSIENEFAAKQRCDNCVAVLKHSINEDADHTNRKYPLEGSSDRAHFMRTHDQP
jgi:hypothetical protein